MAGAAETINERECDFSEALAAMHELVGSRVSIVVMGAAGRTREAAILLAGRVERGIELGPRIEDAVGFEIGGLLICLSEVMLAGAWRGEYTASGMCWRAVGLRYRGGIEIEVDELPGDGSWGGL